MRCGIAKLSRFIVTCRVAKHRTFSWCDYSVSPDSRLFVIAREDDATFGILSSRIHEVWSLATASMHGVGNDPTYNAKSCFETFPFPDGLTPTNTVLSVRPELVEGRADAQPVHVSTSSTRTGEGDAIAAAAQSLNTLRNNWLNPGEWVEWVRTPEEENAGYPARPVAKPGHEDDLKKRTLTNLYNVRPAWLDNAHKTLDAAVARAYGWTDYTAEMPDEEILRRLLALNLARSVMIV